MSTDYKYYAVFTETNTDSEDKMCVAACNKKDLLDTINTQLEFLLDFCIKEKDIYHVLNNKLDMKDIDKLINNNEECVKIFCEGNDKEFNTDKCLYISIYTLEYVLEKAKKAIEEEMKEKGFIDDSDNTERFVDDFINNHLFVGTTEFINNVFSELDWAISNEILKKEYNNINSLNQSEEVINYYYSKELDFDSLEEFYNHFGIVDPFRHN